MRKRFTALVAALALASALVPAGTAGAEVSRTVEPRVTALDCVEEVAHFDRPRTDAGPQLPTTSTSSDCPGGGTSLPADVNVDVGPCDCTNELIAVDNVRINIDPILTQNVPPVYLVDCEIPNPVSDGGRTQTVLNTDRSCPIPFGVASGSTEVQPVPEVSVPGADGAFEGELLRIDFGACQVTVTEEDPVGSTSFSETVPCVAAS